MAIFQSPGVNATETDLSAPVVRNPTGTPPVVVAPTVKGPAFVPTQVTSEPDFVATFGKDNTNTPLGYLSAREWFKNTTVPLVHIRVLGAGDGLQSDAQGRTTNAGFVVGGQQPVEASGGALGNNPYANSGGVTGSVYVLGCFMSESSNSTMLSEAGLQTSTVATPIVRGILMAPSGVVLRMSSAAQVCAPPASTFVATELAFSGCFTGSIDLSSGGQSFVMMLNGHKGTDSEYPNILTASFDPQAANYFGSVFNTDPLKIQQAGHLLWSRFDVPSAYAVPTGSGVIVAASGSAFGAGKENIAFLVPSSGALGIHTSSVDSTVTPNYENFRYRFETAVSPWVISQNFGGDYANLFRFHALTDGVSSNDLFKISILNIQPATATQPYGSFDVLVRSISDTDQSMRILEAFTNCNLNPESPNYVARKIGTAYQQFNFEAPESEQKILSFGDFANVSRYVRIELSDDVESGNVSNTAVPFGFRGPQHLVTAGSSSLYNIRQGDLLRPAFPYFNNTSPTVGEFPLYRCVQPPVPMRANIKKSAASSGVDTNLFWGVQFQKLSTPTDPNSSAQFNPSISSYARFYPGDPDSSYVQFSVFNNTDQAATTASWILDSDRFNYNLFSLEKVKVVTGSNGLPSTSTVNLLNWAYVRTGSIPATEATKTRALTVDDLDGNAAVQSLAKFSFYVERGWDGVNMFNRDQAYLTNAAISQEITQTTRGLTSGPTVQSYMKALNLISDVNDLDVQLMTMPGVRVPYVTDSAINVAENDRFDCFYIMDTEQYDSTGNNLTGSYTNVSVTQTAQNFVTRGVNSSFAATYFPDVNIKVDNGTVYEKMPASVAALGAFAKNDFVAQPFNAPAGYNRGTLANVSSFATSLNQSNADTLYVARINPMLSKPGIGPVIWGQKTLLNSESLLNRVNVRRLMIAIRRDIRRVASRFIFEPAREATLNAFNQAVQPILQRYQAAGGVEKYKISIDTSTTTQADLDNKTIKGKIFVVPTTAIEFVSLDFVVSNRDNFVQ